MTIAHVVLVQLHGLAFAAGGAVHHGTGMEQHLLLRDARHARGVGEKTPILEGGQLDGILLPPPPDLGGHQPRMSRIIMGRAGRLGHVVGYDCGGGVLVFVKIVGRRRSRNYCRSLERCGRRRSRNYFLIVLGMVRAAAIDEESKDFGTVDGEEEPSLSLFHFLVLLD